MRSLSARSTRPLTAALLAATLVFVACGSEPAGTGGSEPQGSDAGTGGGGSGGESTDASAGGDSGADSGARRDGGPGVDGGGSLDGGRADGATGDGGGGGGDGGPLLDGGSPDAGATLPPLLCSPHTWKPAVPASGDALMAYRSKAYLFGTNGVSWTVVQNGAATTGAIPLPAGIVAMQSVTTELGPSGRPFVTFTSAGQRHGAFFDGAGFVGVTALGQASEAHADAGERIFALTPNGLTEHAAGSAPVVRGALPYTGTGWTVAADGTVYVLRKVKRPSTIHVGSLADELRVIRLPRGSLTWGDEVAVGSNEGWGFSTIGFAAALDGSLHIAYTPLGIYFRSRNGTAWVTENLVSFATKATMVDPAAPGIDGRDPAAVTGNIRLVAAQDYDHASVTLTYNGGSFSVPGYYFLRRCPPFNPTFPAWPADRLAMSGAAFGATPVGIDERGLPSIATYYGVRQDVSP